jgi:hypothetical protein
MVEEMRGITEEKCPTCEIGFLEKIPVLIVSAKPESAPYVEQMEDCYFQCNNPDCGEKFGKN